jgi:ATP synthase protein I
MFSRPRLRPIRIVLRWQVIATAVLSLAAALLWGGDGAISAALGGGVNVTAGWLYGWRVSRGRSTAGDTIRTLLRAEAIKVLAIVLQLWGVLTYYRDIVHVAFFGAFVVTVIVFAAAIAVRDEAAKT